MADDQPTTADPAEQVRLAGRGADTLHADGFTQQAGGVRWVIAENARLTKHLAAIHLMARTLTGLYHDLAPTIRATLDGTDSHTPEK